MTLDFRYAPVGETLTNDQSSNVDIKGVSRGMNATITGPSVSLGDGAPDTEFTLAVSQYAESITVVREAGILTIDVHASGTSVSLYTQWTFDGQRLKGQSCSRGNSKHRYSKYGSTATVNTAPTGSTCDTATAGCGFRAIRQLLVGDRQHAAPTEVVRLDLSSMLASVLAICDGVVF